MGTLRFCICIFSGFTKSVSLRSQFMETQAFQDIMQDTSMYDAHSTASSEAGSPFPATGVMSVNSENEMPSIEAAHSTTSSYEDDGKLCTTIIPSKVEASNIFLFIYVLK